MTIASLEQYEIIVLSQPYEAISYRLDMEYFFKITKIKLKIKI